MKTNTYLTIVFVLITTVACSVFGGSGPQVLNTPILSVKNECSPENWKIKVRSTEERDMGDGTKLVIVRIGVENNDILWGTVSEIPHVYDSSERSVYLTTKDGSTYDDYRGQVAYLPSDPAGPAFERMNWVATALLAPGFSSIGTTEDGYPALYGYAFDIPNDEIPEKVTIGQLQGSCIQNPNTIPTEIHRIPAEVSPFQ